MNDQPESGLNFDALSRADQDACNLRGSRDCEAHLSSEDLSRLKDVGLVAATEGVNLPQLRQRRGAKHHGDEMRRFVQQTLTAIGAGAGPEP